MSLRALIAAATLVLTARQSSSDVSHRITGDVQRGQQTIVRLECGVCHVIPGIPGARGRVGPSLAAYRRNVYIAGRYPNLPEVLVRFVRDAPSLAPDTAMPSIAMSEREARDIAAYLYSLE